MPVYYQIKSIDSLLLFCSSNYNSKFVKVICFPLLKDKLKCSYKKYPVNLSNLISTPTDISHYLSYLEQRLETSPNKTQYLS